MDVWVASVSVSSPLRYLMVCNLLLSGMVLFLIVFTCFGMKVFFGKLEAVRRAIGFLGGLMAGGLKLLMMRVLGFYEEDIDGFSG
ncbi:MAG: hypothetical protein QXF49_07680 [Thermosphaera sp.]